MAIVFIAITIVGIGLAVPAQAATYREMRDKIRDRARSQLGASYRSGGTSPSGFDCSGFTKWTFGKWTSLPHSSSDQFSLGRRSNFKRVWKRKRLNKGDLVFFKTTRARIGHVGVYLGKNRFISATSSSGVIVNSIYDKYYWGSRYVGATRTPLTIKD